MRNLLKQFTCISLISILLISCSGGKEIYHTILFDTHGGNEISSQTVEHGHKVAKPNDPTKLGYNFVNWTCQDEEWSFVGYTVTEDMVLDANWELITYKVKYILDGGILAIPNPSQYTIEDNIALHNPTKEGNGFTGWYDENNNLITYLGQTVVGDLELTAKWSVNKYNLTVTSEDETKGRVSILSGNGYSGESITVLAMPIGNCTFKGWYHNSEMVSDNESYSFVMPSSDYSLIAVFMSQLDEEQYQWNINHGVIPVVTSDGNSLTYGLYPQKRVSNDVLISSLNALTESESNGWYLYNKEYYAKINATPLSSSYTFDDGATIIRGETYWFKCESISWKILSFKDEKYLLLSSSLLDAQCYYHSTEERIINGIPVQPYNYEHSDIRAWMINDFYNSAFALENKHILVTTVENKGYLPTEDKVFLLTADDYKNTDYHIAEDPARYSKPTDWAKARGARYSKVPSYLNNGVYYTRSVVAYSGGCHYTQTVDYDGSLKIYSVDNSSYCVRPSLYLKNS